MQQLTGAVYKLLVLGDSRTGKTNIISRFLGKEFNPNYHETIGVDFTLLLHSLEEP